MSRVPVGTLEIELITNVARLQREMADIRRAVGSGMSDVARNAKVANDNLEGMSRAAGRTRAGLQQAGFQMQDFAVQVAGGTSALRAASQQLPQLFGALQLMGGGADDAKGKFAQFAGFLGGPWGVAIGVAIPLIGMFAEHLLSSGKAADDTKKRFDALRASVADLSTAMGKATNAQLVNAQGQLNIARLRLQNLESLPGISRSGIKPQERLDEIAALRNEIGNLEATIAGVTMARKNQALYDAATEKAAESARAARSGAAAARKEEREAMRDAEKAAAQAEHIDNVRSAWLLEQERKLSQDVAKSVDDLAKQGLSISEWGDKLGEEQWQRLQDQKRVHQENLDLLLGQLGVLEQMTGPAGEIAKILRGMITGQMGDFGGTFGKFSQAFTAMVPKNAWKPLIDALQGIFGKGGELQKSLGRMLQGAALGNAAGSLALGKKNSELGASIGGAIGTKVGEKLGKTVLKGLGDFAGPLGSIVGGILGGALGGLFKKTKYASSTITSSGGTLSASAPAGNSSRYDGQINGLTGNVITSLNAIVDQLGGALTGPMAVSIGIRKGEIRVDRSGTGQTKGGTVVDFYDDAAGAIAYAIKDAINDGVIQGMRASTLTLVKQGDDLNAALAKAMQFEGVFAEIRKRADPTAFALEELGKQFDRLRKIFAEAGATAAEYAQLEQLLAMQRADIELDKLNKQRTLEVQLLEAQGKASEALALQRTIELSTTEDWLKTLQSQVYAAQDAAQAQADLARELEQAASKFKGFASDLKSFRDSLGGSDTLAMTYRQAMTKLISTGALAIAGDETALGGLSGVGRDFLAAAKDNASSAVQYQRDIALLTRYVDDAIATADYLSGNPGAASSGVAASAAAMGGTATGQPSMAQAMADWKAELAGMRAEQKSIGESIAMTNSKVATILARVERAGGALAVVTDDDAPLHTVTP